MKSRDEIIQDIYNSDWLKNMLVKFGGCNSKDLGQDYFEILCKKTDEEINQIYPYIRWWSVVTLRNMTDFKNPHKAYIKNYFFENTRIRRGDKTGKEFFIEVKKKDIFTHNLDDDEFKTSFNNLEELPEMIEEDFDESLMIARNKVLDRIYWFDRKLFEIYESGVKYSAIYRKTGIHHTTIKKSITTTIQLIKKEYERINGHC